MNNFIKNYIEWTGGNLQFFVAVHNRTGKTTYKIQLRLWNDMFSSPNLSNGGSLNQVSRVIVTQEQSDRA